MWKLACCLLPYPRNPASQVVKMSLNSGKLEERGGGELDSFWVLNLDDKVTKTQTQNKQTKKTLSGT